MTTSPTVGRTFNKQPWPILALGFRPFFLLAALFAAAAVPLWLLVYQGEMTSASYLLPTVWHGHEMIFGFSAAVIAGFLLTAASNWTGRKTASGVWLAGLVVLWIIGRIAVFAGPAFPDALVAGIDVAFLPVLAVALAIPILAARNRRNMVFPAILLVLGAINLMIHLCALHIVDWDPLKGLQVAIDLILLMIGVLGGRVIPSFTKNALPAAPIKLCGKTSMISLIGLAVLAIADAIDFSSAFVGIAALAAGIANALRMRGWGSSATRGHPILWILHAGYAWMAVGLVLRGVGEFTDLLPSDAGVHALTVGAIGSMTIGMMSRVALGHTGRPIKPTQLTVLAFWLLNTAALLRVFFSLLPDERCQMVALMGSGGLWSTAFLLFSVVYVPILGRPRLDGKAG